MAIETAHELGCCQIVVTFNANTIIAVQILASKFCLIVVHAHVHVAERYHSWLPAKTVTFLLTDCLPL